MPVTRNFKQAFSGGEISPEMFGRIADNKFQQGAATMRNFIAKPQGPAQNRPGFAFVREVKDSTKSTRLLSLHLIQLKLWFLSLVINILGFILLDKLYFIAMVQHGTVVLIM